jgi:DNA repair protein RecN (Recombination protein N)
MLVELHVAGLGVIDDARITFSDGLTALTGETGAGKTLLVEALDLVLGGRPRRGLVPEGRSALVEAVFSTDDGEVILAREIPSDGRARAWIDGRMSSVSALEERAAGLSDIYGQHEHQRLLTASSVRRALDLFAGIDTTALRSARSALRALTEEQALLGGDQEAVAREMALLEHQMGEIDQATIVTRDEISHLLDEARLLEDANSLRRHLEQGLDRLDGDGSRPRDDLATLAKAIDGYGGLSSLRESLIGAEVLLEELVSLLRRAAESVEEDPLRLTEVNARLQVLHDLCRRHGPTLADVLTRREEMGETLNELRESEQRRASLTERMERAAQALKAAESACESARREAAPRMAAEIMDRLRSLSLERAIVEFHIAGPAGDDVDLLFSANPGLVPQAVAKVASGGELARLMLAIRLTMPGGPPTVVFDEVDAGIGGATAVTLAESLRDVAVDRQVLVVTHLAQVAAAAHEQVVVVKTPGSSATTASAMAISGDDRIAEIARMLSGHPDSPTARSHAAELLGH